MGDAEDIVWEAAGLGPFRVQQLLRINDNGNDQIQEGVHRVIDVAKPRG